jgi:hypothetical protein
MLRAVAGLVIVECGLGSDKAAQVEDGLGITAEVPGPSVPALGRPAAYPSGARGGLQRTIGAW